MGSSAEAIDFDDLTTPQLTDVQRQILEFTEARHVSNSTSTGCLPKPSSRQA